MSGAIPPLPQHAFMAWCSVKAQEHLYLLLERVKEPGYLSGIALGYGLDDRRFESQRGSELLSSSPRPDRLWGSPSLLPNEYQVLFP
jgi:hypothetical protein